MSEAISSTHPDLLTRLVTLLTLELVAEITDTAPHDLDRIIARRSNLLPRCLPALNKN